MTIKKIAINPVKKNAGVSYEPFTPDIKVAKLTDYLICFYDGREISRYPAWIQDNIDMQLGLCCYLIHRGNKAILFDTMLYKEHIFWIDSYLKDMGITAVSVINSHWDPDHIAGNFLYRDRDIVASSTTRRYLQMYAQSLRSGEIWNSYGDPNFPGIEEVVLPNRTFDGKATLYLEDIKIELHEVFAHQPGSIVAYIPKDKILLAADACEDTVLFIPRGTESVLPIQVLTYRWLCSFDIERIYPSHGRFEVIENGGYSKVFLEAMMDYKIQLVSRMRDPDYLTADLESFVGSWVEKGVLAIHEPYRSLHEYNVALVHRYYEGQPTPDLLSDAI